ncbi:hypothetical protein [Novosphingobium rosa]|uniref:hypothetical protein n=1 Tax=Novosphingobium rosa TaxID=76978 RepID=UPI00083124CA|nr:hypothetical protein [Novosphingobium rosa]
MDRSTARGEPFDADWLATARMHELRREFSAHHLGIFREYLVNRIRLASPLLLDAVRPSRLDEVIMKLIPPGDWPVRLDVDAVILSGSRRHRRSGGLASPDGTDLADHLKVERLVLRFAGRSAHMTMRLGSMSLHTSDQGGRIVAPGIGSKARHRDLIGRELFSVFRHQVAEGMPYRIVKAESSACEKVTIVEFEARPIEWRVPWGRPSKRRL